MFTQRMNARSLLGLAPLGMSFGFNFAQPTPGGGAPGAAAPAPGGVGRGAPRRAFRNQQAGENVVLALGPHPLYILFVAWRPLFVLFFLGFLYYAWTTTGVFLPPALGFILILAIVTVPLGRFLLDVVNLWLFRRYIVTNWRVVDERGFALRRRKELALAQVQQVVVERPNILAGWLDLGNVIVLSGGDQNDLRLEWVRHPSQVSHQIQLNELLAGPRVPGAAAFRSDVARKAWEKVDQVEEDIRYPVDFPTHAPPISVPFELLRQYDEAVLERLPRHWSALAVGEIPPAIFAIVGTLLYVASRSLGSHSPGIILAVTLMVVMFWATLQYLNYADDLLILTTMRVVDLDRVLYVVAENRRQAMYSNIQNVRVVTPLWGRILGYGTISIETAGRSDDLEMTRIGHASAVQDRIFKYINASAEHKEAIGRRRRRREARLWMAELLNELLVEVPEVRGLSLLDASERLRALGLRMVIDSERADASVTPGTVLEQEPLVGSSALHGSEAHVVLSRQATPADLRTHP